MVLVLELLVLVVLSNGSVHNLQVGLTCHDTHEVKIKIGRLMWNSNVMAVNYFYPRIYL